MKKWKSVLPLLLAVCTIMSCSKSSIEQGMPSDATNALVASKPVRVRSMFNQYDTTNFYWNREGRLDSMITTGKYGKTSYIVFGKGKYVDSIYNFFGTYLDVKWVNFQYDAQDKLIEYTRLIPRYPPDYAERHIVTYDAQGQVSTVKWELPSFKVENYYTYNNDGDVVWHKLFLWGSGDHITTMRTDNHLNPFYNNMPLYIIFGGLEDQQQVLCKHNLVEAYREYEGSTISYRNDYDDQGRLIRKTDLRYNGYYEFSYY